MAATSPNRIFEWRRAEYATTRRADAGLTADDLEDEIEALGNLAAVVARSLHEWREALRPIELARPMDMRRAGAIVLETVFDELLEPVAWRLLEATFALAETSR